MLAGAQVVRSESQREWRGQCYKVATEDLRGTSCMRDRLLPYWSSQLASSHSRLRVVGARERYQGLPASCAARELRSLVVGPSVVRSLSLRTGTQVDLGEPGTLISRTSALVVVRKVLGTSL